MPVVTNTPEVKDQGKQMDPEEYASDLLRQVITLGRAGRATLYYRHLLAELRTALERAPEIRKVLQDSMSDG